MSNIKRIKKNIKEEKKDFGGFIIAGLIGAVIGFALCFLMIEIITIIF